MGVRFSFPGLSKRVKVDDVEQRFRQTVGAGGYALGNLGGGIVNSALTDTSGEWAGSEVGYRGIKIKVVNMAKLDLAIETKTTEKDGTESLELSKTDPICDLWNKDPKAYGFNAVQFKRVVFGQFEKQGQAFVYTPRSDPKAVPEALIPIFGGVTPVIDDRSPDTITDPQEQFEARRRMAINPPIIGYRVVTTTGVFGFLPSDIMWFRDPSYLTTYGADSTWNAAYWPTELDQFARQWQSAEFQNGGHPTGVIYLGDLNDEQAKFVKAQFEQNHTGASNARRHLFIYGANQAKYDRIGQTPAEMSYIESHVQNQKDTLVALGIPVDKIMGESTFDNQAAADTALWADELDPTLELFEAEIDKHLLPETARRAVFDRSRVAALQENADKVQERAINAWKVDLLTLREARSKIGMGEGDDESDDRLNMTITEYQAQFKQSPVALVPNTEKPEDEEKDDGRDDDTETSEDEVDDDDVQDSKQDDKVKGDQRAASTTEALEKRSGAETHTGVMVAFMLDPTTAQSIAIDGYEEPEFLHCTLAYLGRTLDEHLDPVVISEVVAQVASEFPPLSGTIAGRGVFDLGDEGAVAIGLVDMVGIGELRARLVKALNEAGQTVVESHGFTPHVTIGYTADDVEATNVPVAVGTKLAFDSVAACWGDERTFAPLTGISIRGYGTEIPHPSFMKSMADENSEQRVKQPGYSDAEADRLTDRYEKLMVRVVKKLAKHQSTVVIRKFKKAYRKANQEGETRAAEDPFFDVEYWVNETGQVFENVLDSLYFDVGSRMGGDLGVTLDVIQPYLIQAVQEQVANSAVQVNDTTRNAISEIIVKGIEDDIDIDEIARDIAVEFENMAGHRATMIAKTEVRNAYNFASLVTAYESGIVKSKSWEGDSDPCPEICLPVVGEIVPLDGRFSNGLKAPCAHPSCQCRLRFQLDEKALEKQEG